MDTSEVPLLQPHRKSGFAANHNFYGVADRILCLPETHCRLAALDLFLLIENPAGQGY
jgi:hypothetical protein